MFCPWLAWSNVFLGGQPLRCCATFITSCLGHVLATWGVTVDVKRIAWLRSWRSDFYRDTLYSSRSYSITHSLERSLQWAGGELCFKSWGQTFTQIFGNFFTQTICLFTQLIIFLSHLCGCQLMGIYFKIQVDSSSNFYELTFASYVLLTYPLIFFVVFGWFLLIFGVCFFLVLLISWHYKMIKTCFLYFHI